MNRHRKMLRGRKNLKDYIRSKLKEKLKERRKLNNCKKFSVNSMNLGKENFVKCLKHNRQNLKPSKEL